MSATGARHGCCRWAPTAAERHRMLVEWNSTRAAYPDRACVHQLIEEQVERTPEATAVACDGRALSYRELDGRANQVARYLRRLGVGPNVLVGICMHRCLEMVVGLLGTLKAGGAYVPLDPAYPRQRLSAMFEDVDLKVVLTKRDLAGGLPALGAAVVCLDEDAGPVSAERADSPPPGVSAQDLAYVIFTSGSTGRPKAAAVVHRGWTNLMHWFVTALDVRPADRVLVASAFGFDITQRSIVMPLIAGGQLHLLASKLYDPLLVRRTIHDARISLLNCSPSMFYPLVETPAPASGEPLRSLRALILGGEAISASRLRAWAESDGRATEVVNVYGVAECTDVSSFHRLRDYERYAAASVPLGKPIFNSQLYVLDDDLQPVAPGAPGQICIAGHGVGRGYINDPALTAERFVANPFGAEPGERLYKTGDLGRWRPDGTLEFIGRADHQVKVAGQRIEPGDIEAALRQHPGIVEAVVMSRESGAGEQRLVAYVAGARPETAEDLAPRLRAFLKERLPRYMVPAEFVVVQDMPLSPNGKIDRSALRGGR